MFCNVIWCLNLLCNLDTRIACLRELFPAIALRILQTSHGGPFVLTLQNSQATVISSLLQESPACVFQSFPYNLFPTQQLLWPFQSTNHIASLLFLRDFLWNPTPYPGLQGRQDWPWVPLETLLPPFSSLLSSSHCSSDKPLISQVLEYPGLIPTSKPL